MMAKSKPPARNFRSYIDLDESIGNGHAREEPEPEPPVALEPDLLPGETPVAAADRALLFLPMTERRRGLSGRLHVTTFRLAFVTLQDAAAASSSTREGNLILGKHICLANIDRIYQLSSNGKRKLLPPRSHVNAPLKGLQIRCKDFRVLTFSFKCSQLEEGRAVANALLMYCYPRRPHLLFAFDYKAEPPPVDGDQPEREVGTAADWQRELEATGAVGWRVSHCNEAFRMSHTLPEVLVVPRGATDAVLTAASGHYSHRRPPVWCWGAPDGSSIARAATSQPPGTVSEDEQAVLDAIRVSHPAQRAPIKVDIGNTCPSVDAIQQSYLRLREICSPESARELAESDGRFLGQLSASRWPWAVSRCLEAATNCVRLLNRHKATVILTEWGGRDLTALVSCVAQLLVEPRTRSLDGFQRLVHREWVTLGHPFQERAGLVIQDDSKKGPVFLLFLDCVYQLLVQFPAQFQFTSAYLVSLWDASLVSVFDTFLFDSERQRQRAASGHEGAPPLVRRSAWRWPSLFSAQHRRLFTSALWEQTALGRRAAAARAGPEAPRRPRRLTDQLAPVTSVAAVRLWTRCYCRWVPCLDVAGGGDAADDECQRRLVAQLEQLQARLDAVTEGVGVRSQRSLSAPPPPPLPSCFHPFAEQSPTPLLSVAAGRRSTLLRSSTLKVEDGALASHRVTGVPPRRH